MAVCSRMTCASMHLPLQDWSVRTEDPWEADLFYVPALTYFFSS